MTQVPPLAHIGTHVNRNIVVSGAEEIQKKERDRDRRDGERDREQMTATVTYMHINTVHTLKNILIIIIIMIRSTDHFLYPSCPAALLEYNQQFMSSNDSVACGET